MKHLPNLITFGRLLLALVLFALLARVEGAAPRGAEGTWPSLLLDAALVVFVVAALTDLLDGWVARRLDLVTDLGRVADPFVDKVIVCGSFVFLAAIPGTGVAAWMVVAIIGREFLVSGLRGVLEGRGKPFGALAWGKAKMALQCVTIGWILFYLAHLRTHGWADTLTTVAVWVTVVVTLVSAVAYVGRAARLLAEGSAS